MSNEELFTKVCEVVADKLSIDKDSIRLDSRFQEDLGADSLDIVELLMKIEENFSVNIPDEESEKLKTVGDAVNFIVNTTK